MIAVQKAAQAKSLSVIWIAPNADAGQQAILDSLHAHDRHEGFEHVTILTALPIEGYGPLLAHATC